MLKMFKRFFKKNQTTKKYYYTTFVNCYNGEELKLYMDELGVVNIVNNGYDIKEQKEISREEFLENYSKQFKKRA